MDIKKKNYTQYKSKSQNELYWDFNCSKDYIDIIIHISGI